MNNPNSRRVKGILMQIIAEVMFGFSFMFTKEATGSASPLEVLSWRFMLAASVFFLLIKLGLFKVDFRGKNLKSALLLGFLHPILYFLCENQGIAMTSASESGTIIATIPIFVLLVSFFFLRIRPTKNESVGIFITLAGALILILCQGSRPTFNLPGYILLFGSVISYSFFAALSLKNTEFSSVEKAWIMIISGAVFFTVVNLCKEAAAGTLRDFALLPFTNRKFLTAILYLGIGSSIIAFSCNNYGIETLGTNAASSFTAFNTMISVLAGVVFLHEPFSMLQAAATILIIIGVYIANKK